MNMRYLILISDTYLELKTTSAGRTRAPIPAVRQTTEATRSLLLRREVLRLRGLMYVRMLNLNQPKVTYEATVFTFSSIKKCAILTTRQFKI